MSDDRDFALQRVQSFDVAARDAALLRKDRLFDGLELGFEHVDDRKVAIDDCVHQRVEHETGSLPQQFRLAFAALAYSAEGLSAAAAHREDVVRTDEDVE